MQDELARLHKELRTTFVMVTHDQGEALALSTKIAVFNQGNLEQMGAPAEIYNHPKTAFVAGFIGRTNLFEVQVLGHEGSYLKVSTNSGLHLWVKDNLPVPPVVGDLVKAWVRMDAISVQANQDSLPKAEHGPLNVFDATIGYSSYHGSHTEYQLLFDSSLSLRASRSNHNGQQFTIGQKVVVTFPADMVSVLAGEKELVEQAGG
jgi:spermidine/putrescine transport system ATP-binding protein